MSCLMSHVYSHIYGLRRQADIVPTLLQLIGLSDDDDHDQRPVSGDNVLYNGRNLLTTDGHEY
jgi:hypothetical protein